MHSQRAYRTVQPVSGRLVADVQHLLLYRAGCLVQLAVLGVGRVDELLQVLRLLLPLPLPGLNLPQLGQQVLLLLNLTDVTGQVRSGQEVLLLFNFTGHRLRVRSDTPQSDMSQVRSGVLPLSDRSQVSWSGTSESVRSQFRSDSYS